MKPVPQENELSARESGSTSNKTLFVGFGSAIVALSALIAGLVWAAALRGGQVPRWLTVGLISAVLVLLGVVALGVLGLVTSLIRGKPIPLLSKLSGLAISLLLPIATKIGEFVGIDKDRMRGSFIEVHNQLTRYEKKTTFSARELLVLVPICLQKSTCKHKISVDVDNCRRCGKCQIGDLLDLRDKYGFHLAVPTGGTLARKLVGEKRPRAVVAVACERDLTSGIQDTRGKLAVLGVPNDRPNGPCFETRVNVSRLEDSVRYFLGLRPLTPAGESNGSPSASKRPGSAVSEAELVRITET